MILTLSGSNYYLLQQRLHEEMTKFISVYGDLAIERHDGEETSLEAMKESLTSSGFLATNKLVILRSPSSNKQFAEKAQEIFADIPETTDVIIIEPKLDKRLSYAKYLQKNTEFVQFSELDEQQLTKWLVETANKEGANLTFSTARFLVERVGPNQTLLHNELQKLLLHDNTINREDVEVLVEPLPQSTIFELLDAAFAGNLPKALDLYQEQRALKVEPQQIMAMIAWQLHVLALVKTAAGTPSSQIATDSHIHPFVIQKNTTLARQISANELRILLDDVLDLDVRMKTTGIDPDEAMKTLITEIATK